MHCAWSRKTREGSKLSPLADFEVLCRQEVKTKAQLSTACLSIKACANVHIETPGKDWETYWFQALKEISV